MIEIKKDTVVLSLANSSCTIHLYGATVTSWKYAGKERFFLSENAVTNGSKAIRGGIPLVFPQFGPTGKLPQHGFARLSMWSFGGVDIDSEKEVKVHFTLEQHQIPAAQLALWPHGNISSLFSAFRLIYTVSLSANTLKTSIKIQNIGTELFQYHFLFHTYVRIPVYMACNHSLLQTVGFSDSMDIRIRSLINAIQLREQSQSQKKSTGYILRCKMILLLFKMLWFCTSRI